MNRAAVFFLIVFVLGFGGAPERADSSHCPWHKHWEGVDLARATDSNGLWDVSIELGEHSRVGLYHNNTTPEKVNPRCSADSGTGIA